MGRLERVLYANYTVPQNPPDLIVLFVIAKDFAGNETSIDLLYHTRAEWTGFAFLDGVADSSGTYQPPGAPAQHTDQHCTTKWLMSFAVFLPGKGPAEGSGNAQALQDPRCT